MPNPAALFDIDGTLADTNYLHVQAWSQACDQVGHPVDDARIHRAIGLDSSKLLERLLGDKAETLGEQVKGHHQENYAALADRIRPLGDARALLRELADRGWQIVLATSAPPEELKLLRKALAAEDVIAHITGDDDVETAKPDPDLVQVAMNKAGVSAEQAVMIGDTVWDGEAAGKAGVRFVGVRSGGIAAAELRDAGAIEVYDDPADLLRHLEKSVLARTS